MRHVPVSVVELSTVESVALVSLVADTAYRYRHGRRVPAAGSGTPPPTVGTAWGNWSAIRTRSEACTDETSLGGNGRA